MLGGESVPILRADNIHGFIIDLERQAIVRQAIYHCQRLGSNRIEVIPLWSSSDEVTVAHIPIEGLIKEVIDTPPNLVISEARDKPKMINAIHAPGETLFPEAADLTKTIHDAFEKE